jgi:DNA replication protein DnaC
MNPITVAHLQSLRLTGMLEAWQEQAQAPTYQDLSFDERFTLLVEREQLRRQQVRLKRRLKQAQLAIQASLSDIDFSVSRGLAKSKFLELAQGQWVLQHLHLVIVGPTGVGKTFLASVLADQCAQQGRSVRYFRASELILELKLAKADGSWRKFKRQLAGFNLLIIDDWLRDPLASTEARDLLDLLDERYRTASCLLATQLPINQWHQHIQDPTLADAMLDRVVHDALRIVLKGESMRKLTSQVKSQADST